ncbi:MAG: caspase family protein [Nitrospinae bacterium]|nr:caspase family protein [Nitrospinota bacterium]
MRINKTKAGEPVGTRGAVSLLLLACIFLFSCASPPRPRTPEVEEGKGWTSTPVPVVKKEEMRPSLAKIQAPILEIDAGGHKAVINDVIFTRDGKYLVSASDDKTVLVWDVETGEVVRAIRGQIGEGDEGKIFAAALSPDNRVLAVGGYVKNNAIRLIDFQTGQVVRLLKGHGNVINGLAFSSDGQRLISGSADFTARVWDVRSGETLHILKGHTERIYAVAFSPDGKRVATGSLDHTLKLWDASTGALLATMKGHKNNVVSAAFTPDGKTLLSGSWDKTIRLWNGENGEFIKVLAEQDSTVDSLSISPDGTKVVTGIGTGPGVTNNVFSIPSGERLASFTKHKNIVLATAISPDGRTAATGGGSDKEIYLWDVNTGEVKKRMAGKGGIIWSVGFAKDGKSIAWGKKYDRSGYNMYQINGPLEQSFRLKDPDQGFNLAIGEKIQDIAVASQILNLKSQIRNPQGSDYLRSLESAGPFSIRTANGGIHPTLQILKNGKAAHEITLDSISGNDHRSLTLTPDSGTVISGAGNGCLASWSTETGKKIHDFVGHTGDVFGVAVSPDGRYLVSGSVDQTVKLWEVASGKLLLSIFQGSDEEWVAWVPDGFYAASNNGGKYVGYHINRGEDKAADYVGLDQIGETFYRPDLVAKSLQGGFEAEIRAELERLGGIDEIIASGLPPKVAILSEKELKINQQDFTLEFSLEEQKGGIGKIQYKVNNVARESADARSGDVSTARKSGVISRKFTLPHGRNEITVTAHNKDGSIASKPETVVVNVNDPLEAAPSLYVLAVGISDYSDMDLKLNLAHADAQAMAKELELRGKGLFRDIHVKPLVDKEATTVGIQKEFERLRGIVKPSDVFVLYLAGHGKAMNGNYYFIPWEAEYVNMESLMKASISHEKIQSLLAMVPALKGLVIIDTCFSGLAAVPDSKMIVAALSRGGAEEKAAIDRLMRSTGRTTLAASSEEQHALEGMGEKHGVFTYSLLEGLKGKADRKGEGEGVITIDELADFVGKEVPEITMNRWGYRQVPMRNISGDPFPIACGEGFDGPGCKKQGGGK